MPFADASQQVRKCTHVRRQVALDIEVLERPLYTRLRDLLRRFSLSSEH
jgi:hypothetical protein